jgi:predicted nucleic-acid-binding protein
MRAVDTNVLVRLVAHDDDRQLRSAERFIEQGAWVPLLALAEAVWVLESVYRRTPVRIAAAVEVLLEHERLTIQDAEVVRAALDAFRSRPAVGFSDCVMLESARKAGHLPLGTFDGRLGRLDGAQRI